ncbi:MAG: HIRAN domain-containing protein [bacterium]|nr:HIRAN domain-containing protein [bacterium]
MHFKKTITKYDGKNVCRACVTKLLNSGINAWEIKNKNISELRKNINISINNNVFSTENKTNQKSVTEIINGKNGYELNGMQQKIIFYSDYLEITDSFGIKTKINYNINSFDYFFDLESIDYICNNYLNELKITYKPYTTMNTVTTENIILNKKNETMAVTQIIKYLNKKINMKKEYILKQKETEENVEYERKNGKHRYSDNKFIYLDNDMFLKYSYYDVEIKGIKYNDFDISSIKLNTDLGFEFDLTNEYDKNAIKVLYNGIFLGYVPQNNLQKMVKDYIDDESSRVEAFISEVDEEENVIKMAVAFYKELDDEELKNIEYIDATLIKTNKKDEFDSRQENLDSCSINEEVDIDYDFETETYIVTNCGAEIGEINKNKSEKLQQYEDDGKEFYCVIQELDYNDSGNLTCKIRIFIS